MHYLALVSILWAFSFGLIGNALADLDALFVATLRLGIAGLIFAPFLKCSAIPPRSAFRLVLCGGIQFGLMYVCYMQAFAYLPSHLVALFSILTPIYVVLIHDLRQRSFHRHYLYAALLSVVGAAIIQAQPGKTGTLWTGFALMQVSGIAFGFGQVYYRDWKRNHPDQAQLDSFAWLYAGGLLVALIAACFLTDWEKTTPSYPQAGIILYLGAIASGLGFFLWNKGAALCRPGTLAAFNNAVVPLAMASSLFVFREISDFTAEAAIRLFLGSACILSAVMMAEKTPIES
jgi:drug/metabolite transporter (DMT)-like permease